MRSALDIANYELNSFGAPTLEGFDTGNVQDGQRLRGSQRQHVHFYKKKIMVMTTTEAKTDPKSGTVIPLKAEPKEVEKEFVRIITPGDKNTFDDWAEDYHRREFWPQYKAFRDGKTAPLGTDIEGCSFINAEVATELKYRGCYTVEQLSDASDELCNTIPNGYAVREFARAQVKVIYDNDNSGAISLLKSELQAERDMRRELEERMKALEARSVGIVNPEPHRIIEPTKPKRTRRSRKEIDALIKGENKDETN